MNKIGRNDPCPCGGGKKYKKCHMNIEKVPLESLPPEMIEIMREDDILKAIGYNVPHLEAEFHGKRVRSLFGSICNRPIEETFNEFLIEVLKMTLGEEWRKEQMALKDEDRHFIIKCFDKFQEWLKSSPKIGELKDGKKILVLNGYALWLVSLAFDVYALVHTNHLPPTLINRLKNYNEFQGARYEITVASIFARMGFKIEFLGDDINEKHGEFIAVDPKTGTKIVIEAKSRQRKGVLHHEGDYDRLKSLKGDIHSLINQALKKETGSNPFLIFVDVNTPREEGKLPHEIQWVKGYPEIQKHLKESQALKSGKCNSIIVTNFSDHYDTDGKALHPEYLIDTEVGGEPKYVIDPKIMSQLMSALQHYGFVPTFLK